MEILRAKNALKKEIENLSAEGKVSEAHAKIADLNRMNQEYEVQVTLENEEVKDIARVGTHVVENNEINANVVFNKQLLGKPLTEAEEAFVENAAGSPGQIEHDDERGGFLVPEEQGKKIEKFRRKRIALKDYVRVIPVTTLSGKMPVETEQNGELTEFEELTAINESEITFAQQKWAVSDYGDIIPISNTLLEDTEIELVEYVGDQFSKKAVNTENKKILAKLKAITAGKSEKGDSYRAIKTALNKKLDTSIAQTAKIFTNQSGYNYLDLLEDKNGKPLLQPMLAEPSKYALNGKEVVVLDDLLLASNGNALPFYVGDLEEAIRFYDRKGLEMAISGHAGFTKYATLLRVVERFDVQEFDKGAVVLVEITPGETPTV